MADLGIDIILAPFRLLMSILFPFALVFLVCIMAGWNYTMWVVDPALRMRIS